MPIFFWLLNTTIINTYLIAQKNGSLFTHKEFCHTLIWNLIHAVHNKSRNWHHTIEEEEEDVSWDKKCQKVTKNFVLPNKQFSDCHHLPVH